MKIVAYYALHYGKEWFEWSLRSVRDYVDDIFVFYSPTPSHGHGTALKNPESRDELFSIAYPYRVHWVDCPGFQHEGYHREFAVKTCEQAGADIVLVVDADEIWSPKVLRDSIAAVASDSTARSYRIGMRHFWRSTKWVCDDAAMPTRLIKPKVSRNYPEMYLDTGKVFHFGYAQSPAIIRYKQDIHGHKNEWRRGWFEDKFLPWMPGMTDVHPTSFNWDPAPYRDDGELERLVGDHPYWGKDLI
jgi:hypothetical protein